MWPEGALRQVLQYAAKSISDKCLGEVLQSICGSGRYHEKQAMLLVAEVA
jgi:hypothetical protein